ncbi:MAG TPA: MBL fold metallo-hydrolase [Steroidobacteraceae bacterium]|nr:MBL fold metallo-hydrolase [Steroidobacteraceae bacterium]
MSADRMPANGWSRRTLLRVAAGTVGWRSVSAIAQRPREGGSLAGAAGPATVIHSELKKLAPTAYAFLQREAPGQSNFSISNFGIVEGPRSLLAIDAGGGPQHARNFIAAAQPLGKPFDRIVITHEHPDHIVGLTQFAPGIEIIAQEETRAQMVKMGTPPTPAYWSTNPAWGKPGDVNKVILPTVTFKDRMTLYYGDTEVQVSWPGRAHTSGDALILLPREKILFMGDVAFFGVTPLNGSGFVQDWIKVCDTVLADEGVATIVPGHGPVGGKSDLQEMRDYLALLVKEARRGMSAGISAGRAAAETPLGRYATWTDPDRIATNMARVYAELTGTIGVDMDREAARQAVAEYQRLKARR